MRKSIFLLLIISISVISSCSDDVKKAKIVANLHGMKEQNIIIEELAPGRTIILDTIQTDKQGKFSYNYKFADENPIFLRVRHKSDFLTLLLSPGEKVKVSSVLNLSRNYTVEGSEDSELVRQITLSTIEANQIADDMSLEYKATTQEEKRREIERNLSQLYIDQRKHAIEFLVSNRSSLVSVMVLYSSYPNGVQIFSGKDDHLFFKTVSDSLSVKYPTSLHVKQLLNQLDKLGAGLTQTLSSLIRTTTIPEIDLPDIYGNNQKLTELVNGKAVLLMFWSAADPTSAMTNRELLNIYNKYKDKDFEIYQVSLDSNKSTWLQTVINSNLPWVSVRDELGATRSIFARTYQVNMLPFNYLIDKEGTPKYKNLWGDELEAKVKEVTK